MFVFLDRVDDTFYLGVASSHWGWVELLAARDSDLFPGCAQGRLDLGAFRSDSLFPFPVTGASQVKLIRDSTGSWYLLGFHGDPDGDPNGPDFADVYGVRFRPFAITPRLLSVHIFFRPGTPASPVPAPTTWSRQDACSSARPTGGPTTKDPVTPATSHASMNAPRRTSNT